MMLFYSLRLSRKDKKFSANDIAIEYCIQVLFP